MADIFASSVEARESKGDTLYNVCTTLNMGEAQLAALQKDNGTRTARSIVRACYPTHVRAYTQIDQIDITFRQAIYGKFLHFLNY